MPGALAISRRFLGQVKGRRLTRRIDLPVSGLGVIGKGLAHWLLAEVRCQKLLRWSRSFPLATACFT